MRAGSAVVVQAREADPPSYRRPARVSRARAEANSAPADAGRGWDGSAPRVDLVRPFHVFGAHVMGRTEHHPGLRHLLDVVVGEPANPEVEDLHPILLARPFLHDEDVLGLEIAVHDARLVRFAEASEDLP